MANDLMWALYPFLEANQDDKVCNECSQFYGKIYSDIKEKNTQK